MKFQESAAKLEQIARGFNDATTSLAQIFSELKLTSGITAPEASMSTAKYAASAALISQIETVMQQAANPDSITVAIQLAKIQEKIRIALPGGAVMSQEELEWVKANAGQSAPGNLFYVLAQEQLRSSDGLCFRYNMDLASANFTDSLRANLKRELGEEIGDVASKITLGTFLPGERVTTLATLKLPDADISKRIAEKLADRGLTCDEHGTIRGVYTKVMEKVAVAHGPIETIELHATDNAEAKGIRVKSLGELLELSKKTAESAATYSNFKNFYEDRHGTDGVRNPSTTWGLSLLATWLMEKVVALDPYKEGPRTLHLK